MKRMEELDSPLNTLSEVEGYLKKAREHERDMYIEFNMAAEVLTQNLATLPVANSRLGGPFSGMNSRIRARMVARNLLQAAEAHRFAAGRAVKTWRDLLKAFAPEIDAARRKTARPKFDVNK
jgi:hypothetical protein